MIDRIRRWLRGAFDRRSQVSAAPTATRGVAVDVPTDAIHMARPLLGVCLTSLGAEDRISDISEMRIAPYRHLIELLPLRVYVYSLGSPIAQMDYESTLSSNRPAGAVFDAFELPFRDVHCGFYVYSLQPVTDAATLRSLWRNLREEVGQPVKTAALPALHLRHHGAGGADDGPSAPSSDAELPLGMIPLDSDAEAIVRKLVGQRPPSQQLATYNLVSPQDIMRPIFAFVLTTNEYPFEREELIDFVHRNADILRSSIDFLDELKGALQGYNENRQQVDAMRNLIDVFCRQSKLVLGGREAEVDVRSETIYWLIVILSSQVNQRILLLDAAVSYLEREEYRVRLGAATLRPMLLEVSRVLGTPEKPEPEKLHLLLEAANLCRESAVAIAGRELLAQIGGDPAVASRLESASHWMREADLDDAGREFVREIRARTYTEIDDADL
jgi:hypothetical protein